MNASDLIKSIRALERQGYTFDLRPDGKFLVTPQPQQDSGVFKFCQRHADRIKLELWLRPRPTPDAKDHHEDAKRKICANFGIVDSVFGQAGGKVTHHSYEEMRDEFIALMEGNTTPENRIDTTFLVLARVIGRLGSQGLDIERDWAWRCFCELSEIALTEGTLRRAA